MPRPGTPRPILSLVCAALLAPAVLAGCGAETPPAGAPANPPAGAAGAGGGAAPAANAGKADREQIVRAYDRGLDFLLAGQKDGVWSSKQAKGNPDIGFTAMAVTALLERPGGVREKDRPVVEKGLAAIAGGFDEDGGAKIPGYRNYVTSVMIMALAASGRAEYKPQIAKAAEFVKKLQFLDEENPTYGGIGYGSDNTRGDLSNTQYALASLRAAGVPPSDPVFQRAITYLNRVQNRKENETGSEPKEWADEKLKTTLVRANDGGANYYPGNSKAGFDKDPSGKGVLRSYGSMTFALLRCFHLAGLDAKDGRVQAATEWIAKNWVLDRNPGMPEDQKGQGLFYYYATIGKAMPLTGTAKIEAAGKSIDWKGDLAAHLLGTQRPDGSWLNTEPRWQEADEVLCTCYSLTALAGCAQ